MKLLTTILLLFLTWNFSYSQLETGKYQICLDLCYYDWCHSRLTFNFVDSVCCEIEYQDDVSLESSKGFYYLSDSSILFEPKVRPDSVRISYKFDRKGNGKNQSYLQFQQKDKENVFWLLELNDTPLIDNELFIYRNGNSETVYSDSLGYAKYNGEIADSVEFIYKGRTFTVLPDKTNQPSWIKIYMDCHFRDLFDRVKELKLENGLYWLEYECENNEIRKRQLRKIS